MKATSVFYCCVGSRAHMPLRTKGRFYVAYFLYSWRQRRRSEGEDAASLGLSIYRILQPHMLWKHFLTFFVKLFFLNQHYTSIK